MNINFDEAVDTIIQKKIINRLKQYETVVIFGAGDSGSWCFEILNQYGIRPKAFCDNSTLKQGNKKCGLDIISLQEAVNKYQLFAVCIASMWKEEISNQIKICYPALGVHIYDMLTTMAWETSNKSKHSNELDYIKTHIVEFQEVGAYLGDNYSRIVLEGILNYRLTRNPKYLKKIKSENSIYLDNDILSDQEITRIKSGWIVDGGAYIGDTIDFFKKTFLLRESESLKVIAYEAMEENIIELRKYDEQNQNIEMKIVNKALWNKPGEKIYFEGNGLSGSVSFNRRDGRIVITDTLDSLIKEYEKINYIKLDIEGAERYAIEGGKKLINRFRPILAICAYHFQDDLIVLPKIIKESFRDYKLYLRHYMLSAGDTILYAIPQ